MMTQNIQALVAYRMEQADESLAAAQILLDKEMIRPSVNRSYYAMFYAVLALLAVKKMETSKHSGAISLFDREFVKQGVFKKDLSRWLHDAFDLRQLSDYAAQSSITSDDAQRALDHAGEFVKRVKDIQKKNYSIDAF